MRRVLHLTRTDATRAVALVFLLCLAASSLPGMAFAHAVLLSSSPKQGERLERAPEVFSLRFSEPVAHVTATLVTREGAPTILTPKVAGSDVTIELGRSLVPGAYALSWRVVSEDGHPVAASVVFAVGRNAVLAGLPDTSAVPFWLKAWTFVMKFAFYGSCLFGEGGTFFAVWIARRRPTRWSAFLLISGLICSFVLIVLLALEENGGSLSGLGDLPTWSGAIDGSLARSMTLVALALVLSMSARVNSRFSGVLSAVALLALGAGFSLTGHASGAGIAWLSFVAVSAHVAAVAFWSGSLPGLWRVLGPEGHARPATLLRFSSAISLSVSVMVAAGVYLAYVQVGTLAALLCTDYGEILLVKLTLVAAALSLGAYNRFFLTSRVQRGDTSAAAAMRRVVAVEVAVIVLVLGVTSLWRFTPPPRALALKPIHTSVHLHNPTAMAMVSFETKQDLAFDVEMAIENGSFGLLDPPEVTLRMSAPDGAVSPFKVPVHRASPGRWTAKHVQAPCDCRWNVRVDVLVSDFDMITLNGSVRLLSDHQP